MNDTKYFPYCRRLKSLLGRDKPFIGYFLLSLRIVNLSKAHDLDAWTGRNLSKKSNIDSIP